MQESLCIHIVNWQFYFSFDKVVHSILLAFHSFVIICVVKLNSVLVIFAHVILLLWFIFYSSQLNAAYCDEVVRIEEKMARVKEERRQVEFLCYVALKLVLVTVRFITC